MPPFSAGHLKYACDGADYSLEIVAPTQADAEARVKALANAAFEGSIIPDSSANEGTPWRAAGVRGFTRLLIGQPLASRAAEQFVAALRVRHVPRIVTEIELREIAEKMGLADRMKGTHHPAL